MNASEYDYVDDPSVAIDVEGQVGVAWVDQSRKNVLFQLFGPDGEPRFEEPTNVSRSPRIFSWLPRVVFTSPQPGSVAILWQEIVFSGGSHGGEIFFAHSTDGGRTFSEPLNLSKSIAGDGKGRLSQDRWDNGSLDLALGPGGALYAAWTEYEGALWVRRSSDGGETFSPAVRIAGTGQDRPARGPSLAVSPGGVVYLAWAVGGDDSADIHVAKSEDQGRSFSAPRVVFDSDGHSDAPKLAVDREGRIHLVHAESASGRGGRYHIRYSRAAGEALEFEPPRDISDGPGSSGAGASFPDLQLDGAGTVYVLWEVFPRGMGRSLGLELTLSADRGDTFTQPALVPGTADPDTGFNGSQQGLLMRKLAVNEDGLLAIVNSTFLPNRGSQVWLIRGRREEP